MDSKTGAEAALAQAQRRFVAALQQVGGVPLTVESTRSPLAWSSHSLHTQAEHDYEHGKGPTGRTIAQLSVAVYVRDVSRLDDVGAALTGIPELEVHQVSWHVDADNPQWPGVRAAAIQAAIFARVAITR